MHFLDGKRLHHAACVSGAPNSSCNRISCAYLVFGYVLYFKGLTRIENDRKGILKEKLSSTSKFSFQETNDIS